MIVIEVIQYSLALLMIILLGYRLVQSAWVLIVRRKTFPLISKDRQFAIVISVSEGDQMVSQSLYSLFGLIYPKNLYDVIIPSKNLSTDTANIAQDMGAIIINENTTLLDGGCKLNYIFEQILSGEKAYDAILVIESESLVSGNYLDVINYYFDKGEHVIQSSSLILPAPGTGNEERQIDFLLNNLLEPMDFRDNNIGFTTKMLRENLEILPVFNGDTEYGLTLQLNGIDVGHAQEAVVWKQMRAKDRKVGRAGDNSIGEQNSLPGYYISELFMAAFRYKSLSYFKKIFDLITPPILKMFVFSIILISINIAGWALGGISVIFIWIWLFISALGMLTIFIDGYRINTYFQAYKSIG